MSDLPPDLREFVENSRGLDKMMRNVYLIEYGEKLGDYPEKEMDEDHLVKGCTSTVYVRGTCEDGRMHFQGWSDAQIVRGMTSVLVHGLDGESPDRILEIEPDFIQDSGISEVLTSTRQSGFFNIFRRLQREAEPHAERHHSSASSS